MNKTKHYEASILISTPSQEIFSFIDNPSKLSSHMSKSSWMMGGGKMDVSVDSGRGQRVGSHIKLSGKAFRIPIFLDEVVTLYEPPSRKEWETIGEPKLIVIGHYRMGFEIIAGGGGSKLKVFIDYELPQSLGTRWLGYLFSGIYAKFCVKQILKDVKNEYFDNTR